MNTTAYLRQKETTATPAMASEWATLQELYSRRLWHQLTVKVLDMAKQPEFQANLLVELYQNFVKEFEQRMNKLSYMELCVLISHQFVKPAEAYAFLDNCEKLVKSDPVALAWCKVTRGQIMLEKDTDLAGVKILLEEVDEILKQIDGISQAHGPFYHLQSQYYHRQENLTGYYRSAIKFLGCTPLKEIPLEMQREHAKNLAVSSLVADGMFNFGELLAHPILESLKRTKDEWLLHLVKAFNDGDVTEFENLEKKWTTNKLLVDNRNKLRTKVILLAIMETTFKRPAVKRQLTFGDIADATKLDKEKVESYVMKAIAQGLVVGKIDSVGQKVFMTWVQPRVLGTVQISKMISKLENWQSDIGQAEDMMKRNTVEILDDD